MMEELATCHKCTYVACNTGLCRVKSPDPLLLPLHARQEPSYPRLAPLGRLVPAATAPAGRIIGCAWCIRILITHIIFQRRSPQIIATHNTP